MSSHNFAHFSVLSSLCYLSNGRFLAFLYLPWCTLGQKSSFGLLVQILVWQEFKFTFGCFWMKVWILIEKVKSLIYLPLCGNEAIFPWEGPSLFLSASSSSGPQLTLRWFSVFCSCTKTFFFFLLTLTEVSWGLRDLYLSPYTRKES